MKFLWQAITIIHCSIPYRPYSKFNGLHEYRLIVSRLPFVAVVVLIIITVIFVHK